MQRLVIIHVFFAFVVNIALAQQDEASVQDLVKLAAEVGQTGDFDSVYQINERIISLAEPRGEYEALINAHKDNYFMDRRFRFGQVDGSIRVNILRKYIDNPRVSFYNKSNIAFLIAGYHNVEGNLDSILYYQRRAIQLSDQIEGFHREKVVNRVQMGVYLEGQGKFADALFILTEAEPLIVGIDFPALLKLNLYDAIASSLLGVDDPNSARDYLDKMKEVIRINGYTTQDHKVLRLEGRILEKEGKKQEAISKYQETLKLANSKANDKVDAAIMIANLARLYVAIDSLKLARSYLDIAQNLGDISEKYDNNINQAEVRYHIKSGNKTKAQIYLNKVNAYSQQRPETSLDILQTNLAYHNSTANHKEIAKYLYTLSQAKDSVDDLSNQALARRLEAEFNREKQNIQIAALAETTAAQGEALAVRNTLIIVGGISILVLALLLYGLYRLYRRNEENQRQLAAQNVQITEALAQNKLLIKEIHHRVKNNLQVVSSLLSMQARKTSDELTKDALKSSKARVQSMSILHQSLYKDEALTKVNVAHYFEEIVENIVDTYHTDKAIKVTTDILPVKLDVDVLVPLGLIVNELVTNAYKYAFVNSNSGLISLSLQEGDGQYILNVSDDGVGLLGNELPHKPTSLGSRLIQEFSRQIGGRFEVLNVEKGTSVQITFKGGQ